jgi:hypothetical protein
MASSHWKVEGEDNVQLKGGRVEIKGRGGFGDYIPKGLYSSIRNSIHLALVNKYLSQHSSGNPITIENAKKAAERSDRLFTFDCAKHVVAYEKILKALNANSFKEANIKKVCIIGDGYGYFSSFLKHQNPEIKLFTVNLGKQLLFDAQNTKNNHPYATFGILHKVEDLSHNHDFTFIEAENYHLVGEVDADLFINIASMQEMTPEIVDNYFQYIKGSKQEEKYFFCCNRVKKVLIGGETLIFDKYAWGDCEVIYEEENCDWYSKFPVQKPPFWLPFDGALKARLVKYSQ